MANRIAQWTSAFYVVIHEIFRALWLNFTDGWLMKRKELRGKTVLLTGSAMGIGRELAILLSKKGANLILWDICEKENEQTRAICEELGAKASCYSVDLSSRESIRKVSKETKEHHDHMDIIINNAGIAKQEYFLEKNDEFIQKNVEINALAHSWILKEFLQQMLDRDAGHIVCIASAAGLFGCSGMSDYSLSKFAAVGFQEALETECAVRNKNGVKFTTVCPGYICSRLTSPQNLPSAQSQAIMSAEFAARSIVNAIELEQNILMMPKIFYILYALKGIIPRRLFVRLLVNLLFNEEAAQPKGNVRNNSRS